MCHFLEFPTVEVNHDDVVLFQVFPVFQFLRQVALVGIGMPKLSIVRGGGILFGGIATDLHEEGPRTEDRDGLLWRQQRRVYEKKVKQK